MMMRRYEVAPDGQGLTFWLRPEFILRVVNRFQKIVGFDRSVALASGALTATIPLLIVTSALGSALGGKGTAEEKIAALQAAGIEVAESPADMGAAVQRAIKRSSQAR